MLEGIEMKEFQVKQELADSGFNQLVNQVETDHFILSDIKTQASFWSHRPGTTNETKEGFVMSPQTRHNFEHSRSDELSSNSSSLKSLHLESSSLTDEQRRNGLEQKSPGICKVGRSKIPKACNDKRRAYGSNLSREQKDKEKMQPRTRSGRVSKPPSYKFKDYVFVDLKILNGEVHEDNSSSNFNFSEEELEPSDEGCGHSSALTTDLQDGISNDTSLESSQTLPVLSSQYLAVPQEGLDAFHKNRKSNPICFETDHFILPDIKSSDFDTGQIDVKIETKQNSESDVLLGSDDHTGPFCGDELTLVSPKLEPTTFEKEFETLESEMDFEDRGTTYSQGSLDARQVISSYKQFGRVDIPAIQTSKDGDPIPVDQQHGKKLSKEHGLDEFTLQGSRGRKRLECNYCGKTFRQKSGLLDHVMIHTGEKPHQCYQCAKAFIQRSGLKQHILIHTGEKPHKCNACGMAFRQKGGLNDHMLIYCEKKNSCSGNVFLQRNHILKEKSDSFISHGKTKSHELVKKRSYTAQRKLEIIQIAEKKGNRAAAKDYNISEKNIRYWRKMKGILEKMPCMNKSRHRPGRPPRWPELERKLRQWVLSERKNGHRISNVTIRKKAIALARQDNLVDFGAGRSWCIQFLERNKLFSCLGRGRNKSPELMKRESYTSECKLGIMQKAKEMGNRARDCNVSECNIRSWRKMKSIFEKMPPTKKCLRGSSELVSQANTKIAQTVMDDLEKERQKIESDNAFTIDSSSERFVEYNVVNPKPDQVLSRELQRYFCSDSDDSDFWGFE